MTEQEQKAKAAAEAVAEMNKKVGFDVPLAYAALNAVVINEQTDMGEIPMFEHRCDIAALVEIIAFGHGGTLTLDAVADVCNACVAYGWHWAREGKSLLRDAAVESEIGDYVDARRDMLVEAKAQRKDALRRGFEAIGKAVAKAEKNIKLQREMNRK